MRKSECGITIYLIAGALRRCAPRAIVSHSVPAHHFGWMNHLLSEVAGEGYERLMEVMTAIKSEVKEPMMGRGLGYVKFAKTYPHHFRMQRRLFVGTGYSTGGRRFAPRSVAGGRFLVRYRQKKRLHKGGVPERLLHQTRSKRSRFITLVHAATKSLTNFSCASALP